MPETDDLRLSAILQELREEYEGPTPSYREFWEAARDGVFPAHLRNGWWHARRKDKKAIATALGLKRRRASELTPAA
jgi:hypothetical protein